MYTKRLLYSAPLLLASAMFAQVLPFPGSPSLPMSGGAVPGTYLLSSFDAANTDLDLYFSNDFKNWWALNPQPLYGAQQRDASIGKIGTHYCIIHTGADSSHSSNTAFYGACTGSCTNANACAQQLYNGWGSVQTISVTEVTGGGCGSSCQVWAPEFVRNADNSVYVDGSGFPYATVAISLNNTGDFSLYLIHFTATDLSSKDNATAITVSGLTHGLIDSFLLNTGSGFELWYRAYTGAAASTDCIQVSTSSTLTGTYSTSHTGDWAGWGCHSQDGPSLLYLGGSNWAAFLDYSFSGIAVGQINWATSSDNRATWTAMTPIVTPRQAKQGTIIVY